MPSSSADAIAQSLNEQFQADDVFFQIVEHDQILHVYLNHQPGVQIDYTRITSGIQQAVVSQFTSPADGFWLYSRELGNTEPNWQTYIQTPRQALTQASLNDKAAISGTTFHDEQPIDMVQLTGTTDEMQRIAGFAAVSQAEANAATEIAGSATTASGRVKSADNVSDARIEEEAATELVPFGSDVQDKVDDDDAATELVSVGGHPSRHVGLSAERSDESLDENSETEMVPLSNGSSLPPHQVGRDWDEEAATEMVSLNNQGKTPSLASQQSSVEVNEEAATEMVSLDHAGTATPPQGSRQSGGAGHLNEEAATEMVALGHVGTAKPSQAVHSSGAWDEESATEMVSLGHSGAMPSLASQQSSWDEDSATEMAQLPGQIAAHGIGLTASPVAADGEAATEAVSLGGAAGSVLSSFAGQRSGGLVDEDSATEMASVDAPQVVGVSAKADREAAPSIAGPITAEDLKLVLNRQFQSDGLGFQVTMRDAKWHICANRAAGTPFDFDGVGDRVRRELQGLTDANIDSFWFYSRTAGQRETERKALISLAEGQISKKPTSTAEKGDTAGEQPEIESDSIADLSEYCFVRNRLLLQGKLLPPSDRVAQLLKTFHSLSDSEKMSSVGSIDRIFKGQKPQIASDWLQELEQLSDSDLRKAAIWFSRYCEQPTDTIEQINKVLNAPKAAPTAPKPTSQPSRPTAPANSEASYQSPYSPEAYQPVASEDASLRRGKVNHPKWLRFVLPLAWMVYMAIVVVTGSSSNLVSLELPECQSSASPQACELAALVATPDGVRSMETSVPYTPTYDEEVSLVEACEQNAGFFSGNFSTSISSTLSSVSETLPGVYLVDIQYPNPENSSGAMARMACVTSLDGWGTVWDDGDFEIPNEWAEEMSGPQVLAFDEIPLTWPSTPYEGNPFVDAVNQVGILINPFFWAGVNVFLAAVGLLLTTSLGIGVAATSLETVLIVALIYGALDSVLVSAFNFIPLFSLLTGPFRRFAILSGTGGIFKDFMLDRSNLLKLVMGLTLLFFIQFIGKFGLAFFMGVSAAVSAFS
ncbi:MAG: hypothetical protein AB4050_00930 [Synechococcus sp.]